jgi:hypothetical protein
VLLALAASGLADPARADLPLPDPSAIWTLQGENASITTGSPVDRYYTNGLRLGWTSSELSVPGVIAAVGQAIWGDGRQRIAIDLTQQIYTPRDTTSGFPPLTDRPFAGVLMGTFSALHDSGTSLGLLSLGVGVVGPAALGQQVQSSFHHIIGQQPSLGWNTQLHDQALFQVSVQKTWRVPIAEIGGLETDALPTVMAAAGLRRVNGTAGALFRIGQGLDADYGPSRIRPGISDTDVFRPTRDFSWYVFAGADGQAVGYDVTINGNAFRDSRRVNLQNWQSELQVGIAFIFSGIRLSYTQVFQTSEFKYQKGGLHQLGSLALSVRF